jgi:hypothetical protein
MDALLIALLSVAAPQHADEHGFEAQLHLIPRASRLTGDVDDSLGYDDLWTEGIGFSVEADFLGAVGRSWKLGGYISVGFDSYGGDADTDSGGDPLEVDTLTTSHVMLGFKVALAPNGGFYFDARVGFGAVFYAETEGTLLGSAVTIFDATSVGAGEAGVHFGYSWDNVLIAAGLSGRVQGAPDAGDLNLGIESAFNGSIEIEVAFRF